MNTQEKPAAASAPPQRFAAIDAYRGFVMFLMMGEVFNTCAVSRALPDSGFWRFLCHHQSHAEWLGCSLHDMIQPSFSFLVGAALPFSIAARQAKGQNADGMALHAIWRALLLTLLGVFLRSTHSMQTRWTFEDTLSQIGMGYVFLFALGWRSVTAQWIGFAVCVVGYWAAFALYSPPPGFDYNSVGVSADWLKEHGHSGFAAHWNKNGNLAAAFDRWFLNLFPREHRFEYNDGGYSTLSFIPTLGTMIFGLIAGGVVKGERSPSAKIRWLAIAGVIALVLGIACNASGVCPVVKRIWILYSGGICCLMLAAFFFTNDAIGMSFWSFPLRVIGMNSIAAYCIAHLWEGFIVKNLKTHLGQNFFGLFGAPYEPFFLGCTVMLVFWLILLWMHRRKFFLRL
jgi:heparan-alpha-glucosaminide N-acetyltransferase